MSTLLGRAIRRGAGPSTTDTIDVAAAATVAVTSEQELYPVDHLFDGRSGIGGSCWVAKTPGPQTIILRFHVPIAVTSVIVESEERSVTCTQQLHMAGWSEHRQAPFDAPPRLLRYSPYGPSFHRETWDVADPGVSHVWFRVTPGEPDRLATLTAIILR